MTLNQHCLVPKTPSTQLFSFKLLESSLSSTKCLDYFIVYVHFQVVALLIKGRMQSFAGVGEGLFVLATELAVLCMSE